MAWVTVRGGVIQQDERPVTIQDTWRLIHRGRGHTTRISQSIMTIEDFETTDAGYYICTAQNLQGETTVATTVEFSWLGKWSITSWWRVHLCPWPALGFSWLMFCQRLMSSAKPHPLPCESDPDIQTKRKSSGLIIEVLTPLAESMYFDRLPIYMHFYFL